MPIKKHDDQALLFEERKRELLSQLVKLGVPAGRFHPNSTHNLIMMEFVLTRDEFNNLAQKIISLGGSIREFQRYNKSQWIYTVHFSLMNREIGIGDRVRTELGLDGIVTFIDEQYTVLLDNGETLHTTQLTQLPKT